MDMINWSDRYEVSGGDESARRGEGEADVSIFISQQLYCPSSFPGPFGRWTKHR
jgi:hypothetical protein